MGRVGPDDLAAQLGDEVAHARPPIRRRSVPRPRETRWRTAASDVCAAAATAGYLLALDDVRRDGLALVARQVGEQRQRGVVREQPDHCRVLGGQLRALHGECALHLALDCSPSLVVDQAAPGDRVQPGQRRRSGVHVALLGDDRQGERLRGEVGRHLRVTRAALEVASSLRTWRS